MRYHFHDARNPKYWASEFPASYRANANLTAKMEPTDGHTFSRTDGICSVHRHRLATLREKAGTLLSDDCATALDELARKARELDNSFAKIVEQYRVGPNIVTQWPDQTWIQRVKKFASVMPDDHSDPCSIEFETKFRALKELVDPYI